MIINIATLIEPKEEDKGIEELRILRIGEQELQVFDSWGSMYPLHFGKKYKVELIPVQLDYEEPEIQSVDYNVAKQIRNTFFYDLFGRVENGIFIVGNFKFEWDEFENNPTYENKFVKLHVTRIIVDFLEELD